LLLYVSLYENKQRKAVRVEQHYILIAIQNRCASSQPILHRGVYLFTKNKAKIYEAFTGIMNIAGDLSSIHSDNNEY